MEFRVFFGAHRVGQLHLRAQLAANQDLLDAHKILLPSDDHMEKCIWAAIKAMRKGTYDETTLPTLIKHITRGEDYDKVIILRPSISGSPLRPLKDDILYPKGSVTVAQLVRLMGIENIHLFCALRNPASFFPSCYNAAYLNDPRLSLLEFVQMSDPFALRWSEYLHRVQGRESEIPLNLWTFEDYPYIWRSVAAALAGLPNKEDLVEDKTVPLDQGMSLKGLLLMQKFFEEHPAETPEKRLAVAEKFEIRFPPVAGEVIPDMWPDDLVSSLTDSYDDDLYYIERMDNVQMIKRMVYA